MYRYKGNTCSLDKYMLEFLVEVNYRSMLPNMVALWYVWMLSP